MNTKPIRVGVIAGELSGDLLGGSLLQALRQHWPDAVFEGIGGPAMQAAGLHSFYPLETLSVMGLVEVLRHYQTLKRCRDNLQAHFLNNPPDVFIGIDAPDFNLGLEARLKAERIPTVHYVSPSVWAWREYRLSKIARACDLMLTLLPFEAQYYQRHKIPVHFVGHPLADEIPLITDCIAARQQLELTSGDTWIALLPGSRVNEVKRLGPLFLSTAQQVLQQRPHSRFVVPLASPALRALFTQQIADHQAENLPLTLIDGQSRTAMAAADVVLLASGTATLEAMLLKRPMVVAYRLAPVTYWLARRLVRVAHVALPNLLADASLVPEFIQETAQPTALSQALLYWLDNAGAVSQLVEQFDAQHRTLQQNASQEAANAVVKLVNSRSGRILP